MEKNEEIKQMERRLKELKEINGSTSKQNTTKLSTPGAIVLGSVLIAAAMYFGMAQFSGNGMVTFGENGNSGVKVPSPLAEEATPTRPSTGAVDIVDVEIEGEPFIGEVDAPVTLAYWMDYQCPFCKRFETTTLIALEEQYVNTGKLRVIFKDFQFLGSDSQEAGIYAKAVWELYPESFLKWNAAMFVAQDRENGGFGALDTIIKLTREQVPEIDADAVLKLSEEKRNEFQQEQDTDKLEAASFGISGTPGFVIGTQTISGAQPIGVFKQVIDSQLGQ